jgi:hypothetical protein
MMLFKTFHALNIELIWHMHCAVGIVIGYGMDGQGFVVQILTGTRFSSSSHCPGQLRGPPSLLPKAYGELFPGGVKWQRREADHSSPTSPEAKKCGYIHSPLRLHCIVHN